MRLADTFLRRFTALANRTIKGFTADAVERLTACDWPGNIRQLQDEVQRAVLLSQGDEVCAADLSPTMARGSGQES